MTIALSINRCSTIGHPTHDVKNVISCCSASHTDPVSQKGSLNFSIDVNHYRALSLCTSLSSSL